MTIDKAIEEVQQQKLDYQEFWEEYKNEHIEALDMAIKTMRKYQKIEQIVKEMKDSKSDIVGLNRHNTEYYMDMIERVLEDGKID